MFFLISKTAWRLAEPDNLLLALVIAGAVLSAVGCRRLGPGLMRAGLALLLFVATVPLGGMVLARLEQRFPAASDEGPADGIVVLGGGLNGRNYFAHHGSGLNGGVARITEAARLADRFKSARILYSGGPLPDADPERNEGRAALELFTALGIAPERVTLELESRNTYENALFAKRMLAPKPGERWLLVTSAFHMPRAIACFRAVGFPVEAFPVDYRFADHDQFGPGLADGLADLDLAIHEVMGLAAYRLFGKTKAFLPGP